MLQLRPEQPAELEIVDYDVAYDLNAEYDVIVADAPREARGRIDADGRRRVAAVPAA